MTVYIKGKSKAAINRAIVAGDKVVGTEYNLGSVTHHTFNKIPDGTVVKVYDKFVGGSPFAKSYGQVKNGKIS